MLIGDARRRLPRVSSVRDDGNSSPARLSMQIVSKRIPLDGTNPAVYPACTRSAAPTQVGTHLRGGGRTLDRDASMKTMTARGALLRGIAACGVALALAVLFAPSSATTQDKGTLNPKPL